MNKKTIKMLNGYFKPNSKVIIETQSTKKTGIVKRITETGDIEIDVSGVISSYNIYNNRIELVVNVPDSIKKSINEMISNGINPFAIYEVKKYARYNNYNELINYINLNLDSYLQYIKDNKQNK